MTRALGSLLASLSLILAACDGGGAPPGDTDAGTTLPVECTDYPEQFNIVASGETFPPYRWTNAFWNGGRRVDFGLTDFYCGEEYQQYDSLLIVVGAGWCAACPPHAMDINSISSQLRANGTLVAYLLTQNVGGGLATGAEARTWVDTAIGNGWGLRLGDGENSEPGAIAQRANPVPTGYFIRKSDMVLLADENEVGVALPYTEIAMDPTRDWPTELGVMFMSNCPAGSEEASEPNNTLDRAQEITGGAGDVVIRGGVCDAAPDYYHINIPGSYDVFLDTEGALDIAIVDESGARLSQGRVEGTRHSMLFATPNYLIVSGPGRATAPYTLTVHPW